MSLFEDAMSVAVQLPMTERERLARALGLNVHTRGAGKTLPLNQFVAMPQTVTPQNLLPQAPQDESQRRAQGEAWRRAETGHAVVDTGQSAVAPAAEIVDGPRALLGLFPNAASTRDAESEALPAASELSKGGAALVHSSVCFALAAGDEDALRFFEAAPIEARFATATYLSLLGVARNESDLARVQRFVAPYAVLSLGPMASSRAVELMIAGAPHGLEALDALIAATALAHEIPLVTLHAAPFAAVRDLKLVQPR